MTKATYTLPKILNSIKPNNIMRQLIMIILGILSLSSCVAVREYDKVYLNDEEMILATKSLERFETNFQIYREAAAGANGGKTGGGCGCN
jgi:hypothetical protein